MSQYGQVKKILPFRAMSKRCKFTILQGMSTKIIPQTHPNIINVQRHHTNTIQYPQNIPKALFMHNLKWTQTNRHSLTSQDPPRCCLKMAESVCWRQLMSVGMCWLLLLSGHFCWLQLVHELCLGNVLGVLDCIWMVSLDVYGVRMCLRDYLGVHPLQSGEFTPLWHSPERQYFLHLAILTHQNIKMSRYIINKNGWVLPFFTFLVSVREKLKNTFTWITL